MKFHFDRLNRQAQGYDAAVLTMRIVAFACVLGASLCLAIGSKEMTRKVALVLTISAASVPAADQVFHVSEMHKVAWHSVFDIRRLFDRCVLDWESAVQTTDPKVKLSAEMQVIRECRKDLDAAVDRTMEIETKPLEVPKKMGPST